MLFNILSLNQHDLMPLTTVFGKSRVKKIDRVSSTKKANPKQLSQVLQNQQCTISASDIYQGIEKLSEHEPVIFAHQIMQESVVTLTPEMKIDQALNLFQKRGFRHLPVVLAEGKVTGMVSDRDVLQYQAGLKGRGQKKAMPIERLMKSPVITAVMETDVRYIARLFIERRIGAIPIVDNGALTGIVTRSDILQAMIIHYELELWA